MKEIHYILLLLECAHTEPIYDILKRSPNKDEYKKREVQLEHTRERSEEHGSRNGDNDSKRSMPEKSRHRIDTDAKPESSRDVRSHMKKVRDYDDKGRRESVFRIYLRNLSQSTTFTDVERLFRAYGEYYVYIFLIDYRKRMIT